MSGDVLTRPLACELLNRKRGEGKRRPWREVASEKPNEAEMRVMDSACWLQQEDQEEKKEAVKQAVMIVLACSDAQLRLLVWQSDKLTVQDEATAGEHCLLQVGFHLANKSIHLTVSFYNISNNTGTKVRRDGHSGDGQHRRGSDGLESNQGSAAHLFGKAHRPPVRSQLPSGWHSEHKQE